jgi:hypothetical protein
VMRRLRAIQRQAGADADSPAEPETPAVDEEGA